ncbi:MAG: XdhC/CoxI family protein [Planctomycetota bacterium]|nr:XdhC/CoxI family protein [Planctomycetota bacterium]
MPKPPPTPESGPDLFEEIVRLRASGEPGALATVIGTRGSTPGKETMRLLVKASGEFVGTVGGGCVEADVVDACLDVIESDVPKRLTFRLTANATGESGLMCGGELEVFIEPVTAPQLVLFGAGHISKDLCTIAARAGFRVTVVDDRATFANAERFPEARAVIAADTFTECFERLSVPASACCVVVTRGHAYDLECTEYALHTAARYVGLIGSHVKVRNILRRLASESRLDGVDLERLHAPIGIDLGGGTHGEIAVSIVAELIAHRRGHLEGLRTKRISTHEMQTVTGRVAPATEESEAGEA